MSRIAARAKGISPSLTLEITAKAKKMKEDGVEVVSFGAGEPDFNTPAYIIEAAKDALDRGMTKYTPASGTLNLRKAVCEKLLKDNDLAYEPNQIVIANGAKHALYNAFAAVVDPGDEVILPAPYWLTYPELIKLADGVPVVVETKADNDFKMTPDELLSAISDKTRAVVLNNPCNPSGVVYTKAELYALAAVLEGRDIYIVSDEIYEKLTYEDAYYSIAGYSDKIKDMTIVVNGVSKTYSMTGWRIGYTASNASVAKAIGSMQSHMTSNANSVAQHATYIALTHHEGDAFLSEMKATFDRRRRMMIRRLGEIKGLSVVEPKGAFYVMVGMTAYLGKSYRGQKIGSALDAANLLIEHEKVAVIPCESFGAPGYLRLSYAIGDDDIEKGLDRIARFVSEIA